MRGSPYFMPYERLVATTHEPIHGDACWLGNGRTVCRGGYHRTNFYVPGLGRNVAMSSHVAMFVATHGSGIWTADDLFLAYWEFRCSGLEIDHTCVEPACRNPSHLEAVTPQENSRRRDQRRLDQRAQLHLEEVTEEEQQLLDQLT